MKREKLYEMVLLLDVNSLEKEFKTFNNLLASLESVNLLCNNEVKYFYDNDFFSKSDVDFLEDIQKRVLFHRLEENKIMNSKIKKGGFIKVANGSRIQGTIHVGGLQPHYIVDSKSEYIENFVKVVQKETKNIEDIDTKITKVGDVLRTFIKRTEYDDKEYLKLLEKYRILELEIPLSEYIKIGKGVCREMSLLTTIALNEIGIDSYYYYAKVSTNFGKEKEEDHAIVLVKKDNKITVIDNYFRAFNNKTLDEIQKPEGIEVLSGLMYDEESLSKKGLGKVIMSRLYPENKHHPRHIK